MKFYLCQTPEGPQLAGTQADAKAIDPKFETVEWATDKDALMKRFNDLMRRPTHIRINDVPATADEVLAIGHALDEEDGGYPPPPPPKKGKTTPTGLDWASAPEPGACQRCIAMSEAARNIEGVMAITNIEHTIASTEDKKFLGRIDDALEARALELKSA